MKFVSKQDKQFLLRKALFLRYGKGTIDQKKDELDRPFLTIGFIAKLLKIPEQQLKDMFK